MTREEYLKARNPWDGAEMRVGRLVQFMGDVAHSDATWKTGKGPRVVYQEHADILIATIDKLREALRQDKKVLDALVGGSTPVTPTAVREHSKKVRALLALTAPEDPR
jgi:hypothetical protein